MCQSPCAVQNSFLENFYCFAHPAAKQYEADFPIPVPERLPAKIDPCPIVEAILELRQPHR
jgi:hypothetical protein